MLLVLVRALFILSAASIGVHFANTLNQTGVPAWLPMVAFFGTVLGGIVIVVVDMLLRRKNIGSISAVYIGLVVGLILSYLLQMALEPTLGVLLGTNPARPVVSLALVATLCYLTVSLIIQTKNDFRFIIPYVEFAKEMKGNKPLLLDTSVIIDGRIADICETKIIDNVLVVPRFVLQELQNIADSADKLRRNRGRRGLDMLNRLQSSDKVEIQMHDGKLPDVEDIRQVDHRLVMLGKKLSAKVVTTDYSLNKIARLHGVEVINVNDLANAMKPVVLPGESMSVKLIKAGEEAGQGVGYLEDGTMVVAEQGRDHIGDEVTLTVTSVLQTSAGRMIFGRLGEARPRSRR